MKVCLISPYPPQQDGVSEYSKNLTDELSRKVKIVVLAEKLRGSPSWWRPAGNVTVRRISNRNSPLRPLLLFKTVMRERPQVVHIQYESYGLYGIFDFLLTPLLIALLRLGRNRVYVTLHDFIESPSVRMGDSDYASAGALGKSLKYAYQVSRMTVNLVFRVVESRFIVSTDLLARRIRTALGVRPSMVKVIPLGSKIEEPLPKSEAKKVLGFTASKVVLCFGFISTVKNVHHLVDAVDALIRTVPDCIVVIAGAPSAFDKRAVAYYENLVERAAKTEGIVFIKKYTNNEEIRLLFSAADMLVLTYPGARGGSAVLSLGLSYGVPILVPDGGTSEFLVRSEKVGLVYENGNVSSMVAQMVAILSDHELATGLAENARQSASRRSWEKVSEMTLDAYAGS